MNELEANAIRCFPTRSCCAYAFQVITCPGCGKTECERRPCPICGPELPSASCGPGEAVRPLEYERGSGAA
jgi:hypothetical protein